MVIPIHALTLIATPIGNLGDLTLRAIETLRECDAVVAEDTRRAGMLLAHLNLSKPLISFHEHNEERRLPELLHRLSGGERLALVTDAGTPSVSDPGFRLVRACISAGVSYTVLPGPSAVLTALAGSGFPPVPFVFGGFLPASGSARRAELRRAVALRVTSIYFESPHRLIDALEDLEKIDLEKNDLEKTELKKLAAPCRVCVARELSKIHEEYRQGTSSELLLHYRSHPPRGEITLLIDSTSGIPKEKHHSEKTPIPRNFA